MNVLLYSWNCCLTNFIMCFSELHLTYAYVLNCLAEHPKNKVFLVTKLIYDKTDLFRIISVYITAEVYFGYVLNYYEDEMRVGFPVLLEF